MINKIVVRYINGRVAKGTTNNFLPNKDQFHLIPADTVSGSAPQTILLSELKAIFFVKDFAGNANYQDHKNPEPDKPIAGRRIKVVFKDGELLVGTTQGYQPGRPGFFLVPTDLNSNIDRCFVIAAAAQEISFVS
ncbi:MAG: hypothetical protein HZB31_07605 [Nitrospirae bacterium]|nr:hypothetical protein [Nitrospirota bacterium]